MPLGSKLALTGRLTVNGSPAAEAGHKQAFVQQDDLFFSQLTVREVSETRRRPTERARRPWLFRVRVTGRRVRSRPLPACLTSAATNRASPEPSSPRRLTSRYVLRIHSSNAPAASLDEQRCWPCGLAAPQTLAMAAELRLAPTTTPQQRDEYVEQLVSCLCMRVPDTRVRGAIPTHARAVQRSRFVSPPAFSTRARALDEARWPGPAPPPAHTVKRTATSVLSKRMHAQ